MPQTTSRAPTVGGTLDYVLSLRMQFTMVQNWIAAIRSSLFSTFYNFSPSVTLRISQFRHVYTIYLKISGLQSSFYFSSCFIGNELSIGIRLDACLNMSVLVILGSIRVRNEHLRGKITRRKRVCKLQGFLYVTLIHGINLRCRLTSQLVLKSGIK